jgi:putative intracellular protease/amidase
MDGLISFVPFLAIVAFIVIVVMLTNKEMGDAKGSISVDPDDNFRQRKLNKIVRVALPGGLIGALATNHRKALEQTIQQHNAAGGTVIRLFLIPRTTYSWWFYKFSCL